MAIIKIDKNEFEDFKVNIDARVEEAISGLDMVKAQFIRDFAKARTTLEKVDEAQRSRAETIYYATLYTLLQNPNSIPSITEDEMENLGVHDYEDYLVVVDTWLRTMRKKNSPSFRLALGYSKLPKHLLYPAFVVAMMLVFWNGFSLIQGLVFAEGLSGHLSNVVFFLVGIDVAISAGKGIFIKLS